jgi:YHS domain-containing protein
MDAKKKSLITMLLVGGFLFVGLMMLNGCKKDEPEPVETASHEGHDHAAGEHAEMAMDTESMKEVVAAVEQTTCPIMDGNPIDKQYFTEYQGKKVYFCCPGCEDKFKAAPEKYLAKLPQFNQ